MDLFAEISRKNREQAIDHIVTFVQDHPHSYASLAVCRRAIDEEIITIDDSIVHELQAHLTQAPRDEIDAYYSIVM